MDEVRRAVGAVWRVEAPVLVASLVRLVRDVGIAEELAQDALVAALEAWPESGTPDKPGAWLLATARHRAIDRQRRARLAARKLEALEHDEARRQELAGLDLEAVLDEDVGDDLLRLMLVACHPVLGAEARVALTLRLLGGLTTAEIARAFLVPESTIAQRIVRAKRTLAEARVAFEAPRGEALRERVGSVLEVLYLVFNEGYAATRGDDWTRPGLCDDAMRLGRVLQGLAPEVAEVHGLVALMELQASRLAARTGPAGEPVLLLDQDRQRWDQTLIAHGLDALDRAIALGGAAGPYALQAAIAACHARAVTAADTDWGRIAAIYEALARVTPSPVVELNRAVAVGFAHGPAAALAIVDALAAAGSLARYHLLPSVRGDLLAKLGRRDEARAEFARAAALATNARERSLLLARAGNTGRA